MIQTPQSTRLHIGIFGRCNSGKSSLINAITGQQTAIVSETAGTTTDLVSKSMEVAGIGPCLFIDTAGFDDASPLGQQRLRQTRKAMDKADIAVMVFADSDISAEKEWLQRFRAAGIPVIGVLNPMADTTTNLQQLSTQIEAETGTTPLTVNAKTGEGIAGLLQKLAEIASCMEPDVTITGNLAAAGDVVMLVMPQDIQAPKGRLILPQAQTIRELLDKDCIVVSCTPSQIEATLRSLSAPPALVITDSQVFSVVSKLIPAQSKLTSFSVLFAHYKGDIQAFVAGADAIGTLTACSRVLIAEACTHAPLGEDIGRVKIPRLLRDRVGEELQIDIVSGPDFPDDLSPYVIIIHCGGCMFNRRLMLSRIGKARAQKVPITNYGIAIAWLSGVLDKVVYPAEKSGL